MLANLSNSRGLRSDESEECGGRTGLELWQAAGRCRSIHRTPDLDSSYTSGLACQSHEQHHNLQSLITSQLHNLLIIWIAEVVALIALMKFICL